MTKFRWLDFDVVPIEKMETTADHLQLVAAVCIVLWLGIDVASRILAPVSYFAALLVPSWWWSAGAIAVIASLLCGLRHLRRHIDRRSGPRS